MLTVIDFFQARQCVPVWRWPRLICRRHLAAWLWRSDGFLGLIGVDLFEIVLHIRNEVMKRRQSLLKDLKSVAEQLLRLLVSAILEVQNSHVVCGYTNLGRCLSCFVQNEHIGYVALSRILLLLILPKLVVKMEIAC